MTDLLLSLANYPVMEILFAAAIVLVLIDYFFPVDWPAYLGYLCFALAMFWAFPLGAWASLGVSVAVWIVLLILHRIWFARYLTNAFPRRG